MGKMAASVWPKPSTTSHHFSGRTKHTEGGYRHGKGRRVCTSGLRLASGLPMFLQKGPDVGAAATVTPTMRPLHERWVHAWGQRSLQRQPFTS